MEKENLKKILREKNIRKTTIGSAEIKYRSISDGISIISIRYSDIEGVYEVPPTIDGRNVRVLEKGFAKNIAARELLLPETEGPLILSDKCFMDTIRINTIVISSSVDAIPEACFKGCLAENIVFSNSQSIQKISPYAFAYTERLSSFHWPESCAQIPSSCFFGSGIKTITGIKNVREVEKYAFFESKIKIIRWPDKCSVIPKECFNSAYDLEVISNIEHVVEIGIYAFHECKSLKTIVWPSLCLKIPEGCFAESSIKEISGIENVKNIGNYAFECTCIEKFVWPEGCLTISDACFLRSNLKEITFPKAKFNSIGENAFERTMFTEFTIPEVSGKIADNAFDNMVNLESVILDSKQSELPLTQFKGCSCLKKIKYTAPQIKITDSALFVLKNRVFLDEVLFDMSMASEILIEEGDLGMKFVENITVGFETDIIYYNER